jgi:hypothetical protein
MAERIELVGSAQGDPDKERADTNDIRYVGIIAKKRVHPRLLIRGYRTGTTLGVGSALEFDNFILETAVEPVEEKYQIVQTFGPDFIFFYGSKPRIFTYSGKLFNTADKPWKTDLQRAWDRITPSGMGSSGQTGVLSGTNTIINGGIARLEYDGAESYAVGGSTEAGNPGTSILIREGYLISFETQTDSRSPNACTFRFSMFVTSAF